MSREDKYTRFVIIDMHPRGNFDIGLMLSLYDKKCFVATVDERRFL